MGAPAGQVQCMICHCHTGCERSKERWRTSSGLFSVYAKWMEAVGVRLLSVSSCVVDSRVISGVFATCLFSLAGLSLDGGCC